MKGLRSPPTIVVGGSGTGVGKTHVACALLRAWCARGTDVVGLKPVETGVGRGQDDQQRLERAAFHVKRSPSTFHVKPSPFWFEPEISPHLAARQAGVQINLGHIRSWVEENRRSLPAVVETAGGLFSPLGPGVTNFDLVQALAPAWLLLVAPDRLGVLHDVTAATRLAKSLGRAVDAIALSQPEVPDPSTGLNAPELVSLGVAHVSAVFPWASEDAAASQDAAALILDRLLE